MKATRRIALNQLELYGYHGVYEHERREGGTYLIDIWVDQAFELNRDEVNLNDTLDYEKLYAIAAAEMDQPEKLIETVANRILLNVKDEFPGALSGGIQLQKLNPPMDAEIGSSSVRIEIEF
ncbi:MAG: dihydroneopterin aldolase [Bacteroidetes bacterium]|nr:MAG: dihydroneopterin aldolase [Bacteroidota bacterium]